MKKVILLFSAVLATSAIFAQSFVDGGTHFVQDFNPSSPTASCITAVNPSSGGAWFSNNNITNYGYNDIGSDDALMFEVPAGNFIDTDDQPFYCAIYYVNDEDFAEPQCEDMASSSAATTSIGIDLSNNPKIYVTAKAAVDGTIASFTVAHSAEGALTGTPQTSPPQFPTNYPDGQLYNPWDGLNEGRIDKTLTTEYVRYELDWSASTAFAAWNKKSDINMWGIAMYGEGDIVYVQKIEFGDAPATSNIKTVSAKNLTMYPNPSTGAVTVSTQNKAGKMIITDMLGSVVGSYQISSTQANQEINLDAKGVYYVNFQTAAGTNYSDKIVIQ